MLNFGFSSIQHSSIDFDGYFIRRNVHKVKYKVKERLSDWNILGQLFKRRQPSDY